MDSFILCLCTFIILMLQGFFLILCITGILITSKTFSVFENMSMK